MFRRSTGSQLHTPPDLTVQLKLQKTNKGRHYTKIGNLDTIWEQQQDRVTVTDIMNIADIADIANGIKRSAFEYLPNSIALPMLYAFDRAESQ